MDVWGSSHQDDEEKGCIQNVRRQEFHREQGPGEERGADQEEVTEGKDKVFDLH